MRVSIKQRLTAVAAACLALLMIVQGPAVGHEERDASFPDGNGVTPSTLMSGPILLVCKADSPKLFSTLPISVRHRNERLHEQCMDDGYRHIQAAIDDVQRRDSRILVLPGVYREEPSLKAHREGCDELNGGSNGDDPGVPSVLSYNQQRKCPNVQNLITIFGDSNGNRECDLPQCGLQIEGTGGKPDDVIIDGGFKVLNGIRADRADGVRFINFTMQRFEFNALYILETDGFLIDKVVGRWNDEYAFLTFAVDHGLYQRCEGYGNGDSAIYPGSASDLNQGKPVNVDRFAVEIRDCRGHHNALGYSGTAGNSVHAHDSVFDHNQTGIATDSLFPNHPGLPQDHAYFQDNDIFSNNRNYMTFVHNGTCDKPFMKRGYEHGVVCPVIPAPIGTGIMIAGGNANRIQGNRIYDNWRTGTYQFNVQAALREEYDPDKQYDTSHDNHYRNNRWGFAPGGYRQNNGLDVMWDDQGTGNCWADNVANREGGEITSDSVTTPGNPRPPGELPPCSDPSNWVLGDPVKEAVIGPCALYDRRGDETAQDPPNCPFFDPPPRPAARQPGRPDYSRTPGARAVKMAAGLSRRAFPNGTDAVVVTGSQQHASQLVGAPLAAEVGGPLLLTDGRRLNRVTADEVRRLDAQRAYVVGDLSPDVAATLRDVGVREVRTISGDNRYETAAMVARRMGGTEVYVARGRGSNKTPGIETAFGIAGLAASQHRPILLSQRTKLPGATKSALEDMRIVNATLYGSERHLNGYVGRAVNRRVDVMDRLNRDHRYGLSAAAARLALKGIQDERQVWVAAGNGAADPLVAAAAVAKRGGVLVTVDRRNLRRSPATKQWLRGQRLYMEDLTFVGQPQRLSERTAGQVRAATSPS